MGATVPDLRGEFIRGWAHDRTGIADVGRSFGSWQMDDFKSHTHYTWSKLGTYSGTDGWDGVGGVSWGLSTYKTGATGGSETRPRNIALLPCIKY